MERSFKVIGDSLCVELFPPEWVGSSIQTTVKLSDYPSRAVAEAAAVSIANDRYHEVNSMQLDAINSSAQEE